MTTPSEVVALVCVVDTSLAVISQWEQLLQEYVVPLLQRLKDLYQSRVFRVGFVSYATAETRPTPLVSKVFFGPPQVLVAQLRDDPRKLGIGQTGSGGSRGMAALEGLVAALELFDTLRGSIEIKASHIVHIAASPPDTADRPLWNLMPLLDSTSWDSLPAEFRKRDINYSNISLQQISIFADLQSSTALGATQTPWFQVRDKHAIHLSGFPSPQQQKGVKRPGDGTSVTEHSPEAKRARIQTQPPQASHGTPQLAPAVLPPNPSSSTQPQPAPPNQNPSLAQSKQALERFARFEQVLIQKLQQADIHEAAGRVKEATDLRQQVQSQRAQIANFKRQIELKARAAAASAQAQAHLQPPPAADAGASAPTSASPAQNETAPMQTSASAPQLKSSASFPTNPGPSFPDSSMSDPPSAPPPMVQRPPNAPFLPPSASGDSTQSTQHGMQLNSPQLAAQMQKLIEQQRNRGPQLGPPQPQPQSHAENGSSACPPSGQPAVVWKGAVTWRGFDTGPPGRSLALVTIHANQNAEQLRTGTWPPSLTLTQSPDPVVPLPILQDWTKRKNGAIIYMLPYTQGPEGKVNSEIFAAFLLHLVEKPSYALAAWNGPSGMLENHILLFPVKNMLAGAVFPSGMPELPKAEIAGIRLADLQPAHALMLSKLGPEQQMQIAQAPKEQRVMWLQALIQWMQKQQRQQQQQQGQQGQGQHLLQSPIQQQQQQQHQQMQQQQQQLLQQIPQAPPTAPSSYPMSFIRPFINQPNISNFLDAVTNRQPMQQQQPQQNQIGGMGMGGGPGMNTMNMGVGQMSTMGMPPVGHQRTPSGGSMTGMPPGLSMEMLQSFMQRNQEGSAGMGS